MAQERYPEGLTFVSRGRNRVVAAVPHLLRWCVPHSVDGTSSSVHPPAATRGRCKPGDGTGANITRSRWQNGGPARAGTLSRPSSGELERVGCQHWGSRPRRAGPREAHTTPTVTPLATHSTH